MAKPRDVFSVTRLLTPMAEEGRTMLSKMVLLFYAKVNVEAGSDGCWLWTGATMWGGYGHFAVNRRARRAHRVAWELFRFPIPKGMWVLHRCDVRRCVNPNHLFLGTRLDNVRDMYAKGRDSKVRAQGEASGVSKLTDAKVMEIRARHAKGERGLALARAFGVCPNTITNITSRRNWKHLP